MKRLIILIAVLGVAWPGLGRAAQEFAKVGTVGAQFLKIGIGARAVAMGSAFVAVADDATSVFWNPAGVARLDRNMANVNHLTWLADIQLLQGAYIFRSSWFPGTVGISARSLYMPDDVERTVEHPEGTGRTFDAGDIAFGLTYARSLTDKFSFGITGSFVQSTLADMQASAWVFDFGTLYNTGYRSLRIGMAISNIGSTMKWIDDDVKMPMTFRVGMAMNLYESGSHLFLMTGDFSHPPDNAERASLGSEYGFKEFFYVRSGYHFNYDLETYSAGLGFKVAASLNTEARVDYAYTDMSELPGVHRISVDFRF